jgi:uncharacterized phiE125 gp8 family phage protein
LLSPNALITLAEAKRYLKVEHDLEDTLIEDFINSATEKIERRNNSIIKARDIVGEVHDGLGDKMLVLRNFPVNTLQSVEILGEDISISNFTINSAEGTIHRGSRFPNRDASVVVSYNAGYTVIPDRFKTWCYRLVSDMYEGRGGEVDE